MNSSRPPLRNKKAFSLVELLTVVAIIGILSAIAVPMYQKYIRKSRTSEAVSNLGAIGLYEETYYSEQDKYTKAGANPTGAPPSPVDVGGRKYFSSGLTGWIDLGKVIPNNAPVYFQYEILAGQINSVGASAPGATFVNYNTNTVAGGSGNCSGNGSGMSLSASSLSIPNSNSSNWFYATAVGNQDGDNKCSLFVKIIDRTDLVIENEIE